MTEAPVGVMHMPRQMITTALATMALVVGGLVLSTPANAGWSHPGDFTNYRLCRAPAEGGDVWRFVSKVRKGSDAPDVRAGIQVNAGKKRVARWSTGWLEKGELQISTVRVVKSPKVRVTIWEEAGDLDSPIGTAMQATVIKPHDIRRC